MGTVYSRTELAEKVKDASNNMNTFYNMPFINYQGYTRDCKKLFDCEYISEVICQNIDKWFLDEAIKSVKRKQGYFPEGHTAESRFVPSDREEEKIAMFYYVNQEDNDGIGTLLDYQTPLKGKRTDSVGKVDLLSYDANDKSILFLELKKPESKETLLRCLVESFTYTKFVDKEEFSKDLKAVKNIEYIRIVPCALFFKNSRPYEDYERVKSGSFPFTKKLIKKLGVRLYCIEELEQKGDERRFKSTLLPVD